MTNNMFTIQLTVGGQQRENCSCYIKDGDRWERRVA